jgi:hypothetical protein
MFENMEAHQMKIPEIQYAAVSDKARMLILLNGGTVSKHSCCSRQDCDCRKNPGRTHDRVVGLDGLRSINLDGAGCVDADCFHEEHPAGFRWRILIELKTGSWLLMTREREHKFHRLCFCRNPEEELRQWIRRIDAFEAAGGSFDRKAAGLCDPEPNLDRVFVRQQ